MCKELQIQVDLVRILASPVSNRVILDEIPKLSEPQFPHFEDGNDNG